MIRSVKKIVIGSKAVDGAGVKLVRVIGHNDVEDFDPFLMFDAFDSLDPEDYIKGFPWHPHRGIETVTYLIKGNIEHGDSLGNKGSILDGSCQWMTAGSGIMHQEMPKASERMLGAQLWLNMPKANKMEEPKYCDITNDMVIEIVEGSNTIRVISGNYKDSSSSVHGDFVKMTYLDVHMKNNSEWNLKVNPDQTVFVYIVEGEGYFGDLSSKYEAKRALLFGDGDEIAVRTGENEIRFFLFSAKPLKEPVAWGGPIVMNTREELNTAFNELREGNFIKHKIKK